MTRQVAIFWYTEYCGQYIVPRGIKKIHKILDKIDCLTLPERVYKILKEKIVRQNLEGNVQITRWINCREEKGKRISTREHKQIVDALIKRDKELACRLVTEHIERVERGLLGQPARNRR